MILSRFFDKGDYGTYKQVMYVYSTLLAVFTLGLPKAYAYFLPKYATNYSRDIISKVTKIFFRHLYTSMYQTENRMSYMQI